MPAILTRGYHPAHDVANKRGSAIGKFDGSDEDAVAHVFDWLVYDEKSPFLNEFCVLVANRKTMKCNCLCPVINSMDASPRTML